MKKIFVVLLMLALSTCMVSCSSSKTNKEDTKSVEENKESEESTDIGIENKAKESKEESSKDKESESEESKSDTEDSADISTAIYVTHIGGWHGDIVRKILTYEYRNNKILKLTEFSSIRYKPVGEKIEESDREEAKEVFGKNAAGTNYWSGGLTTVAERGAELIQIPGKPAFLAESEMLLNLPKGTRILNNSQTRSTLRDKVANLRDRVSNLKGGNSYSGNNYSITINVNGGNPSEVERIVRKVIAGDINKRERTAFG